MRPVRSLLAVIVGEEPPLELQLLGRVVLHSIVVGLTIGLVGWVFLISLDAVEDLLLDRAALYPRIRAAGVHAERLTDAPGAARLWLIALLPAAGALLAGWISRWAPE